MWYVALSTVVVLVAVVMIAARRLRLRALASRQLADSHPPELDEEFAEEDRRGWLRHWLYIAGYRTASAPAGFLMASGIGFLVGVVFTIAVLASGVLAMAAKLLTDVPGNVGLLLMPALLLAPVFVLLLPAIVPTLIVRSRRRGVVKQVGEDFPIFLDLLATLTESGLGFDQALDRIAAVQPGERILSHEVRLFQADLVGGQRRVDALRRMADRTDIPVLSNFTSAVAQAEQSGAGLARTIRLQANDYREYRRNEAVMLAQRLAIKLVIPMVLFFAPALFVATLGPTVFRVLVKLGQFVEEVAPPRATDDSDETETNPQP